MAENPVEPRFESDVSRRLEPWEERMARRLIEGPDARERQILRIADRLLERIEAELEDEDFDVDRVSEIAGALGQVAYSAEILRTIKGP